MAIPAHSGFVGLCIDLTFALLGQTWCERAVHRRLACKVENGWPSRHAAMTGSTKSWLSVNSIEITADVNGACATPARYADMPSRIKAKRRRRP